MTLKTVALKDLHRTLTPERMAAVSVFQNTGDPLLPSGMAMMMEATSRPVVDARDLCTILAALRNWQNSPELGNPYTDLYDIASDNKSFKPLGRDEIDDLCERLNVKPVAAEQKQFAIETDGVIEGTFSHADMIKNNEGDETLMAFMADAGVGHIHRSGGGAAPHVTVWRVS